MNIITQKLIYFYHFRNKYLPQNFYFVILFRKQYFNFPNYRRRVNLANFLNIRIIHLGIIQNTDSIVLNTFQNFNVSFPKKYAENVRKF